MEQREQERKARNLKKLFNMNTILSNIINYLAYLIMAGSAIVILYLSFIQTLKIEIDWTTMGIFSTAAVVLASSNWIAFYRKTYEKVMSEDIAEAALGKYSIHTRYYNAIKDWEDKQLQEAINRFNKEYEEKWLYYVECTTGCKIEEIKTKSYRKFRHPILMWRIKHHVYPQSGYKTSMEVRSLFSFQDNNLNKRKLKADKVFFYSRATRKIISSTLLVSMGASLIPEFIHGNWAEVVLKLLIGLWALLSSVFMGAMNGVRGARLKLSTVEDTCIDLEEWGKRKPTVEPYSFTEVKVEEKREEPKTPSEVAKQLFSNN